MPMHSFQNSPHLLKSTDSLGFTMPQGDIPALQMIESVPGVDPERRRKLMKVLDIDPAWRMHRVSDGQRRRVQICLGLLKPPQVGSSLRRGRKVYLALCSCLKQVCSLKPAAERRMLCWRRYCCWTRSLWTWMCLPGQTF